MDSVTQPHYDEERIREFADEGAEALQEMAPVYCIHCGDVQVLQKGDACADAQCVSDTNDDAALAFLHRIAAEVEVGCALKELNRAQKHIAKGRYLIVALRSNKIAGFMEAA